MSSDPIVFIFFVIFSGAAVLATVALYARQALLVAYIAVGVIVGPSVLGLVTERALIEQVSHIGIMFLLFLLGLDLPVRKLLAMMRETTVVTMAGSVIAALPGMGVAMALGYGLTESLVVGATMMFSSTIIGLKLLPVSILHHRHTGEIIISILLLQDLLAIIVLILLEVAGGDGSLGLGILGAMLSLGALLAFAFGFARWVLVPLIRRFDKIHEYIFLMAIGWCLGMAKAAGALGLSTEIGAFIGGVALATSPIALFIAESLRPLRDFFLVMFFVSLGLGFDISMAGAVALPALVLAGVVLGLKPRMYRWLLMREGEEPKVATEVGVRLGQVSEFSLIIALVAEGARLIGAEVSALIQLTTLITFVVSSYLIVLNYPTPIGVSERLRRN